MDPTGQPNSPADRLALLYHLSQTFNSSLDLDEVLNRVMDEVIVAVRAERGFVMLVEADGRLGFKVARGIDQKTIAEPHFQISRSIVEKVASDGQPVLTSDAQADERFNMRDSVVILGLRSILCVALKIKASIAGVIYVDNRIQAGIFTKSDLELLNAIAATAAIAVENARLYQVAVEKGRLERELQVARQVQANLLPSRVPESEGWEFTARWLPAREVAGDFFDFIPLENGHIGLVIADVSDKGMPAALFMALTRSVVRGSLDHAASPAEGITRANRLVCADASDGMFVTLFYGELDPISGELTYVNAGHNPPFWCQAVQNRINTLMRTGMALGVDAEAVFQQKSVFLGPGDFILLYTDGVTDATDLNGRAFGLERLQSLVLQHRSFAGQGIVIDLEKSILDFNGSQALFDDITLVAARYIS